MYICIYIIRDLEAEHVLAALLHDRLQLHAQPPQVQLPLKPADIIYTYI